MPLLLLWAFPSGSGKFFPFYLPWRSMTSWSIALSLALHDSRVLVLGLFLFQHHHLSMQRTFTFTHPRPFNAAHVHVPSSASIQCSARSRPLILVTSCPFSSFSLIRVNSVHVHSSASNGGFGGYAFPGSFPGGHQKQGQPRARTGSPGVLTALRGK